MNATAEILPFEHEDFGKLRTYVETDGAVLFRATDVAEALGYSNKMQAVRTHCKGVREIRTPSCGGAQQTKFITESDVYRLITHSKLPAAQKFEAWVFEEVLPSIRKTGGYMMPLPDETPEQTIARALLMANDLIEKKDKIIAELRPKALLAEAVVEPSPICYTVSECARYLANIDCTIKRQDVFDELRSRGLMCKGSTAPTRKGIDTGRMVAIASEYREPGTNEKRAGRQRGHVTAKGLSFLVECLVSTEAEVA